METAVEALSILSIIGYQDGPCGYCSSKGGSLSYYARAKSLTTQYYEKLLARGWRRSGSILYKPDLRNSCCPHYSIRLDSAQLRASKDQRQAINRFNRFVLGDEYIEESARLHPRSREEAARRKTYFELVPRIHECESTAVDRPPDPAHDFVVTLEPDSFTEEKYRLFENYQRVVHKDPPSRISRDGFRNFLCASPLPRTEGWVNGRAKKLGSFHQCYRLDGQLVAMATLDLLPSAVSAVYFAYHESIHQWSPGKLSALRETCLAFEEGYRWYIMGYYIHSCKKMQYKADFHPQFVLDPESYDWNPLDANMKDLMDKHKYVSISKLKRETKSNTNPKPDASTDGNDTVAAKDATNKEDITDKNDDNNDANSDTDTDSDVTSSLTPSTTIPLYQRSIPGIMTQAELAAFVGLSATKIQLRGEIYEAADLLAWEPSRLDEPGTVKCYVAELVAALGPDLAREMCVSFD